MTKINARNTFNMRNTELLKLFGILALVLFVAIGCECVPDINTPKEITPSDYANSLFINVSSKYEKLKIESDEVVVIDELLNPQTEFKYYKVWSGNRYLRVTETTNQNTILNLPVSFKNKDYYTIVFYNIGSRMKSIILRDSISELKPTNFSNYRIISAIENNSPLNIEIHRDSEKIFSFNNLYNSISDYNSLNGGNYLIKVVDSENKKVLKEMEFNCQLNSIYNILISGNILNQDKPISISLFNTEIPTE